MNGDLRTIHRYWTGPDKPPEVSDIAQAIIERNSLGMVTNWTDGNLPGEIFDFVWSRNEQVPDEQRIVNRANMVRLYLLFKYGGTWIDHDFLLLRKPHELEMAFHKNGSVCPCYMSFPPGHYLIWNALQQIRPSLTASISSGASLLQMVIGSKIPLVAPAFDHTGVIWRTRDPIGVHFSLA